MTVGVDTDLWVQSRRMGVAKGRIAALEDIRLRLIEMCDVGSANAVGAVLDRLRKDLDYQTQVMVAMQARAAVTRIEQTTAADSVLVWRQMGRSAPAGWRDIGPSAFSAHRAAGAA